MHELALQLARRLAQEVLHEMAWAFVQSLAQQLAQDLAQGPEQGLVQGLAVKSWRAWACWYMACRIFPDYPADEKQIAEEGVREPDKATILRELTRNGLSGETDQWSEAVEREAFAQVARS